MKTIFTIACAFIISHTTFAQKSVSELLNTKDTVELLILTHAGKDLNNKDANGNTPMLHVCRWGNAEMVAFLLKHGVTVDEPRSPKGRTPLMVGCAYYSGPTACKILIDHNANVNAADTNGITPLMLAAQNAKLDVIKLLVDKGADANKKDVHGQTALDYVTNAKPSDLEYVVKAVKDCKIDKDASIALLKSKMK